MVSDRACSYLDGIVSLTINQRVMHGQDAFADWKPGTALPPGERLELDMSVLDPSTEPVVQGPTKQCTLCRAVREEELFRLNRRGRREPYCSSCEKLRSQASAVGLSMHDLRTAAAHGSDLHALIARRARLPL
jgi:hypothetical protein